jgi:fused signal recognition particle receptor
VILMVGVNGVGKTTTIGKLAKQLKDEGNSVMLAAGDTFRAAAVEQLQAWGERNDVPVIAQHHRRRPGLGDLRRPAGGDRARHRRADRRHRRPAAHQDQPDGGAAKIGRVMKKIDPDAPHEVMLVVDATTGQNACIRRCSSTRPCR